MNEKFGFQISWKKTIPELQSTATMWQHKKTGAQLLSFCNNDENKVFGISFRTPPKDSTGVAHILEHSVLNGSQKYPSKEPFVELLKGSLQTFLNAFTYPDKTCYPVASTNLQDYYNLVDVYLDAVFHPLITQSTFEQEGWHVEAFSADEPLVYKGVVYNEMKGVYSSPDSILSEKSQQSLFPNVTYGLDSGGKPEEILNLTYKQFCDFHSKFYHPLNGKFFFWGDDPEETRLQIINAVLENFDQINLNSTVELQKAFELPQQIEVPYAVSEDDEQEDGGKYMLTMNWRLPQTIEVEDNFAFQMLDHILTGLPGSPLRRALIESGLGEDITGGGLENELREMYYSIGLRGVEEENIQAVELLIMDTLADIAETGISASAIEAAINSVEFSLRENNTGRFPVGLAVMLRSLSTWLYDGDPLALLAFEQPLQELKTKINNGEPVFENLIQKWFLKNNQRSTVVLVPNQNLAQQQAQAESKQLDELKKSLSPKALEEIIARSKELKALQEAPENPAALAAIPRLGLEDLPLKNRFIPKQELKLGETPLFFHPQPTAGIVYADLLFNTSKLSEQLVPLLPLFGRAILEMGTKKRDFVELGTYMAAKTGGLQAEPVFLTTRQEQNTLPAFLVCGKATVDKLTDLCNIFAEVLLETEFDDQTRFGQMVLEEKARQEQSLIPAGHSVVALRLQSQLCQTGHLSEQTDGIAYLDFLRALVQRVDFQWPEVLAQLQTIRAQLIKRGNLCLNLTAQQENLQPCQKTLGELLNLLPQQGENPFALLQKSAFKPKTGASANEALLLPAQVNYVGQAVNLYELGYKYHGSIHVILKYLRTGYLWEEIRVKGGAYGAISSFDRMSGVLCLVSYRDPNVSSTLEVYSRIGQHLKELVLNEGELEMSIIGAIGELDTHLLPEAKGSASFTRQLCGDSEEARQKMREQILATKIDDFKALGQVLSRLQEGNICILGGSSTEQFAKEKGITSRKA